MGVAVGISLLSFLQAEICGSSGLAAAILDFQLPVTPDSFRSRVIGFPVPENMGVAVEIFCYLFYKLRYGQFRFGGHHLGFLTSGYVGQLPC